MSACCGGATTSMASRPPIPDDNTLMVNDLPSLVRSLPDRGTLCLTSFVLQEIVCKKVNIRSKPSAQKFARFPHVGMTGGVATFEFVERELARIECARGTHLAEIISGHFLEISPVRSELGPIEDGSSARQLSQYRAKFRIGREVRFDVRNLKAENTVAHGCAHRRSPTSLPIMKRFIHLGDTTRCRSN